MEFKQIQLGVESIINTKATIRRKKRSSSDKKREIFFNLIMNLEELIVRQNIMYSDLNLDFSNYDEKFFTVIDTLLYLNYDQACTDVIAFYLYDRVNPNDGSINPMIVNDTEEVYLNNPYDLWNLLCQINPKLHE